ncbi:uncharacterized protein LOC114361549 isoform X2 [Ostrinia furnacalis]|uniref:uncharacterized protein LOC114361549 isoform X2 n=1 Tax=Ostrinia furnacalis TaxID=93504 RepID=UPI00103EDA1B|nr:uncharacterized protein LOC114361549 isoform X2 [Ostrinia furnacalis]
MFLFLLLALWTAHQTQAHLTYPIVYCNMASTCIHDNRMVCASTMDGCSRRTFLDQCDMYEYNCDYGTRYQETYRLLCSVQYDENGFPQATTMKESCRNKTSEVPTKSSKCCDRPQTWETTTEGEVKTYTIPKSSDSTTPSRPTATSKRSSVSTTPRPLTTTCKQYHIDINDFITTSLDTSTNVISTTASPKNEEKPISSDSSYLSDDNIYISDSSPKVIPIISKEARSTTSKKEKVKKSTTSVESETTMSVINKKTTLKAKDFPSKIILTHKITNSMKYSQSQSWWYPTVCNSKRCQRPVTWETTMRRKKYHGHH